MASRKTKSRANRQADLKKRARRRRSLSKPGGIETAPPPVLKPRPWEGESTEDVAVFAKASWDELPNDQAAEAHAVRDALGLVCEGRFGAALERVKGIARGSTYSDWRLFIRGLIAFYQGELEAARDSWKRLDAARRPARIAGTLLAADASAPLEQQSDPPPMRLTQVARNILWRPQALAAARQIASVRHRDSETVFSPSQLAMLKDFRDDYAAQDRDFVDRFSQACVCLAYFQPYSDTFRYVTALVPGPRHDPRWNLLSTLYYLQFEGAEDEVRQKHDQYCRDLQRLTHLDEGLGAALASLLSLEVARGELADRSSRFGYDPSDDSDVESLVREATQRYPRNREAHQLLIRLLKTQLDSPWLKKRSRAALEARLSKAKRQFVDVFPDEVQTTLELIDDYLAEEQLEAAEALVQQLQGQRLDDPLAKALPWKLKLREAMRRSRRKTQLAAAREALDAAQSLWPAWLSQDWLPFLRAALELRAGDEELFRQLSTRAREAIGGSRLLGDVMTFAALQHMNLPSPLLKPLRDGIAEYTQRAHDLPMAELISLGAFYWDLVRTGLQHRAYRLQANKFGKPLCLRLNADHFDIKLVQDHPALMETCSWLASHGFWVPGAADRSPGWIKRLSVTQPKAAAAILSSLLRLRYFDARRAQLPATIELLKDAAKRELDPFYRHRFATLARRAGERLAELEAERGDFGRFDPFDPFEDNDGEDDGPCQCPNCRAARERTGRRRSARSETVRTLFDLGEEDEADSDPDDPGESDAGSVTSLEDFEDDDFDSLDPDQSIPPIIHKVAAALGPNGGREFMALAARLKQDRTPSSTIPDELTAMLDVFLKYGLDESDLVELLRAVSEKTPAGRAPSWSEEAGEDPDGDFVAAWEPVADSPVAAAEPLTAQQRREELKQRRKARDRIMRQRKKNRS